MKKRIEHLFKQMLNKLHHVLICRLPRPQTSL